MTKRLQITIGPNRQHMQIANVNDSSRPTIINSEYFIGRVLVKIRDFDGITPDGSPPIRDHVYFDGRSRKFDIQIEGRFKRRHGVEPYSGEEVHFGSDFDHLVDFPKGAFNAGMRVARWIDPNTFYQLSPPNGRPFIMSPYLACMNTLCAWPAPHRLADALVCLRHSDREDDDTEEGDDMVPMEQVDPQEIGQTAGKKKIGRHPRRYWRFIGLRGDGARIDAFLEKNRCLLAEPQPVDNVQNGSIQDTSINQPSPASDHHHRQRGSSDSHHNDQQGLDGSDDGDDATSCRAPSSHATYSTAIEGHFDCRPPPSSASSYRFSPRIFPRHQISFGAGMRDHFQDAETEANEREGEARIERMMMETVGEDDQMVPPLPPDQPLNAQQSHSSPGGHSLDGEETGKKSSNKVKHRLKKLKSALQKLTPSSLSISSSPGGTPSPQTTMSPSSKHYSTTLHSKIRREPGSQSAHPSATVSRAASRTLPFGHRNPSQNSKQISKSTETMQASVSRRATLMPRPQSHHPSTTIDPDKLQIDDVHKFRSTSLDQSRFTLMAIPPSLSLGAQSNLHTIPDALGSPFVPIDQENGEPKPSKDMQMSVSSPVELSGSGSPTTATPPILHHESSADNKRLQVPTRTSYGQQGTEKEDGPSNDGWPKQKESSSERGSSSETASIIRKSSHASSVNESSSDQESRCESGSPSPANGSRTPLKSPLNGTPSPNHSNGTHSGATQLVTPPPLKSVESASTSASKTSGGTTKQTPTNVNKQNGPDSQQLAAQIAAIKIEESETESEQNVEEQVKRPIEIRRPSQIEIDEAPELKDVEEGDLMFANMLNLSNLSGSDDHEDEEVEKELGVWRFKDPTTDILEDNTFVFLNKSVDVQKRRKYFSEGNGKNRKTFTYDPDVVYATSFFSPFMDFNTFDLAIGPVKMNVSKVLGEMPIRYTLRSTRIDEGLKNQNEGEEFHGQTEEEIFVTIAFELIDEE